MGREPIRIKRGGYGVVKVYHDLAVKSSRYDLKEEYIMHRWAHKHCRHVAKIHHRVGNDLHMEAYPHDLSELREQLNDAERHRILVQLAECLSDLHQLGYWHGDIKGNNVLLDEQRNVYVTDWYTSNNGFNCGTRGYLPPENDRLRIPGDVWAFGSLIHWLHTGSTPEFDADWNYPAVESLYNEIMRACHTVDVSSRPRMSQILELLNHMNQ